MKLRVLSIDVIGNARDGFELNDWRDSGIRLEVDDSVDDDSIIKAVRKSCGHRADARGYALEITESTCNIYASDGKPCYCCDIVD